MLNTTMNVSPMIFQFLPPKSKEDILERIYFSPIYLRANILQNMMDVLTPSYFEHVNSIYIMTDAELEELPIYLSDVKEFLQTTKNAAVFDATTRDIVLMLNRLKMWKTNKENTLQFLISLFHEIKHSLQFNDENLTELCIDTLYYQMGLSKDKTAFDILEYDAEGFGYSIAHYLQQCLGRKIEQLVCWEKIER